MSKRMIFLNKDLTVGSPGKVLREFCIPLLGSIVFQQLYNIADSLVAGRFIGENALAAVGNSYEITLIFLAFAFGCNMGCSVVVSQLFGAKDYKGVKTAVFTASIFSAAICAFLMLLGVGCAGWLLGLIRTPQEVLGDSKLYLDIYVYGLPFVFFYNISTGIFSAMGDSKTPFYFLAVSSVSNIAVDILFVSAFQMGVAGVAWATFLCQGVSCILAVIVVLRRLEKVCGGEKAPLFSRVLLKKIIVIAIPSILQQSFISVGNIIIQGVINGFGAGVMAGYSAAVKLNNLVLTCFTTVGNGVSNYTAQNIGAGKLHRVKEGFRAGVRMIWTVALPLSLLYFFGGKLVLALFLDESSAVATKTGLVFLRILAPFYFVISAKLICDGILRGAGMMKKFMVATFVDLLLRVILALTLSRTALGDLGIWASWPVGWVAAAVISLNYYRTGPWIKNIDPDTEPAGED